jgi:hypothetical protein
VGRWGLKVEGCRLKVEGSTSSFVQAGEVRFELVEAAFEVGALAVNGRQEVFAAGVEFKG